MSSADYEGRARIVAADGSEADVRVTYWVQPATGTTLGEWNGVFTITEGHIDPDDAELRLPDGRAGRIVVTNVNVAIVADTSNGRFVGSGEPPH